jgi:multidrug efflux pump subunit AcrA (membrane-fusion protein)
MPDYLKQVKQLVARYEAQARKEVNAQLPRRRQQLLAAVRKLRKVVNQRLAALERRLMSAGSKRKR